MKTGKRGRRPLAGVVAAAVIALVAAGCASSHSSASTSTADSTSSTVKVKLTPQGCQPVPATVTAGAVEFDVANSGAGAVSEAELRTADLSKILGEQENLTPGLTGSFSLNLQAGKYVLDCPGAAQQHWTFTVTGKSTAASWQQTPTLAAAVSGYSSYVEQNAAALVSSTQSFCQAVDAGNRAQAEIRYPQARVYYEHIEPVAEIWGSLDTNIDGRWENPVTVASQFIGFHRIEQLIWEDNTLTGTPALCSQLVKNEQDLLTLVKSAQYNPITMAAGSTDLINEAATAKISGEEERYSNTDFPVFQANIDGAMEVVTLLTPYLQTKDPSLLTTIKQRNAALEKLLAQYRATPGYDNTGYVEYSTVLDDQRKALSTAGNAFAEALSGLSLQVS